LMDKKDFILIVWSKSELFYKETDVFLTL
jgi:hypothetical protein